MVAYTIFNGTDATLANVNVGGIDVPKRQARTATLTDAELAAVCVLDGVAVMQTGASHKERRACAKVMQYRKVSAGAAL